MEGCEKKSFSSIEEADIRAGEINSHNSKNGSKVRLRPYRCKKCSGFHLTSMSKSMYRWTSDLEYRHKAKREAFIKTEAEHWIKKLKLDEYD